MKKAGSRFLSFALSAAAVLSLAGCGDDGSVKKLQFFTWGNETETALMRTLIAEFNELNKGSIEVSMTPIPSGDYETKIDNVLGGKNVPDVIVAGDGEIKQWIDDGAITPLDDYAANSTEIDLDKMWEDGVNRYRYDVDSRKGGEGKLYGIMRDYSPSVLFYNLDAMEAVGIECISETEEESLSQYGTKSAYFEKDGTYYFNNQIATTWEEFLALSQKLTSNAAAPRKELTADKNDGFYTGDTLLLREVNEKNELSSATERANLKARLGDDGVYFLATVKDKVCTRHNDSIWNNDGIEFLIDGAGTGGSSVFRDGILRVGIDVDGGVETDIAKSGVNDYIPFRRAAFANVGVNTLEEAESAFNYRYEYVYEVMIPYSSLGFTEKPVALAFGWAVKTPNERACILDRMGSDGNMEAQDWLWEDGHFPQNPNEYFEVGEAGIPVKTHYDFPEWTAWENCAVQADAKERYNFRGKAADNGLYLNVEQYVDNYVRGSNWDSSTHIELEIWQHNIGWGFGGTYFAFFGNGSYFINKEDNVKKIVNQVTVADRGAEADFRYVISYEIFIEFDNNLENSQDGPYAFVQIMSFTPNETDEGYEKAVKITKDGNRELWTDNCNSYGIHENGIDSKDTGA